MFKVQSPEKDIFASGDLHWKHDIAYIPTNRLHQFLAGEELGSGTAPTKFKIMSSRTRKEGSLQVHRIRPECWLKYTRYWCTYGPKDHRNASGQEKSGSPDYVAEYMGSQTGSSVPNTKRQSTRGEDFARGCTCHFNVKVMYLWPNITQINYVHKTHTDASGRVCHGSLDPSAVGSKAQFAPRLSMDMRRWVLYLLSRNMPPKQILHEHQLLIKSKRSKDQEYTPVRDDFLNKNDILNISKRLGEETFPMQMLEDESIRMWADTHQEYVLYQQHEDKASNTPFILCIQTPWQKDKLVTLGHKRVVACSTTLGTHRFKYQLFTLLVFDVHQSAIPGAWIVTSSNRTSDFEAWLSRLNQRMNEYVESWRPSCFIVDNCGFEINAIRSVFDVPIFICLWRVRRSWLKHLNRTVQNVNTRSAMFRRLGEIMYLSTEQSLSLCNTETQALKQLDSFLADFKEEIAFSSYFKKNWLPNMGLWIKATQNFAHTNLDINSAIEGYHANLKARIQQGRESAFGRRIDWLLHALVTDVESHFWFIDFSKRWGFCHKITQQLVIETSLLQAIAIPDCNVTPALSPEAIRGVHAPVTTNIVDTEDSGLLYTIYNSDTEWLFCDCEWSQHGYLCKHQVKILIMKGTIGVPAQVRNTWNMQGTQEGRMCQDSVIDHNLSGRNGSGKQLNPPLHMSFTPGIVNDLEDGFVEDEIVTDRHEEPTSKIQKSFRTLVNSVSDIDNVVLANRVAGIVTNAAHKISKARHLASNSLRDNPFQNHDFIDNYWIQNGGSSLKRARPMVEEILNREDRATQNERSEIQSYVHCHHLDFL